MNPLNIRGQFQSHWYNRLITKVIKEQVSDKERESAGCKEQGKFPKLESGYSLFLHAFSWPLQKKYFTGMVQKWRWRSPKYKHYPNYIYFQYKFIPKVSPLPFMLSGSLSSLIC